MKKDSVKSACGADKLSKPVVEDILEKRLKRVGNGLGKINEVYQLTPPSLHTELEINA
jgi:hypothetical protein